MDDTETIIRNSKNFGDRLLDLKNTKRFCDAEIVVGTERIPVHKNILASSSAYFETIFSENKSKAEVKMENTDFETVQSLIDYCYTGNIRVSEQNLPETMRLAKLFKMTAVYEGCVKMLEK